MKNIINPDKLDFWIKNRYNVLFEGKHGVGKTAIITAAFNKFNLRWLYFSASTMDPYLDLCGIPREQKLPDGTPYLDLVRPLALQLDQIDAIFFDEYNRSGKKIRNAVMELIQFKSINGKKFNNLKIVWAAINPDEEDVYDVEKLDPAQADRFHIKVNVPYEPCLTYFSDKYGDDNARAAISWWKNLADIEKNKVSPRRLDYALDVFIKGGDVRDLIPTSCNCSKLLLVLKTGPVYDKLGAFMKAGDTEQAKTFLQNENQYAASIDWIIESDSRRDFFVPLLEKEKTMSLMAKKRPLLNYVIEQAKTIHTYACLLADVLNAGQNDRLTNRIKRAVKGDRKLRDILYPPIKGSLNTTIDYQAIAGAITSLKQTYPRLNAYEAAVRSMPKVLTRDDCIGFLLISNSLAERTQAGTLKNNIKDFMGPINRCLLALANIDQIQPMDILANTNNKYTNITEWLLHRIMGHAPLINKFKQNIVFGAK